MKHRASSDRRIDAPDRRSGQTYKQTDKLTCLFSVCVLDGVWHLPASIYLAPAVDRTALYLVNTKAICEHISEQPHMIVYQNGGFL